MKNKILLASLVLSVFAVGCAESAYTPNPAIGNNTGMYPPNPMNPMMPVNPMMNPTYNQPVNPMFNPIMNQQMMYQNQMLMRQRVFSWNMRLNPGFYMYSYNSGNCLPRRTYTTYCTQQTVRPVYTTATSSTEGTADNDDVSTTTTSTDTSDTEGTPKTKVKTYSLVGDDARAMYDRMAIEEVYLTKNISTVTGQNFKCMADTTKRRDLKFACDFELRMSDGIVLLQYPVGKTGIPIVRAGNNNNYKGTNLIVGGPGLAPEEGYLKITGSNALELFNDLPGTAKEGKIDESGLGSAQVKTVGHVKCYQPINTVGSITECLIKIKSDTAAVLEHTI